MGFFYLARQWDRRCRIRNPAEEKDLFILHDLHIGSEVHPASYNFPFNEYKNFTLGIK
jgi:hypothetical protein